MEPIIVGQAPFCHFTKIQDAIDYLEERHYTFKKDDNVEVSDEERVGAGEKSYSRKMVTMYILSGIYRENVLIYMSGLRMVGLGYVEITANRYAKQLDEAGQEIGTFATPTLFLGGSDLVLENLVISNTAGQGDVVGQAVAVYAHCDRTVFRNCSFKGHQDTLFTGPLPPYPRERQQFGGVKLKEHHSHYRQFYERCYIEGTIDFIFGGATAYFEACEIHSLALPEQRSGGFITAASTPKGQEYGYVFDRCYLTGAKGANGVFLGRPWREFAKTVFISCLMGDHIHPLGWDHWNNSDHQSTVHYGEYGVINAKVIRSQRVPWAVCDERVPMKWSKERVFSGTDFWSRSCSC